MTSTLCQSAALDRIIAPWTARIAELFSAIVETILAIAEIVPLLAPRPGLSRPMTPKLATVHRYDRRLRHKACFLLPPSLHACPQALAASEAGRHAGSGRQERSRPTPMVTMARESE